ncbi:40S ribosomal protein S30 [Neodidymelliopsis sp. IMI 364377]|nr:40S ribosomal protein S30 [Neodidymelliopsis sp. IMI 364377]
MGKVHGSLARAGKVKSQTPKVSPLTSNIPYSDRDTDPTRRIFRRTHLPANGVEPQEKKKTPKGRAKKRLTYTRRFVNVTMTGGKRKVSANACS